MSVITLVIIIDVQIHIAIRCCYSLRISSQPLRNYHIPVWYWLRKRLGLSQ